MSSGKLTFPFGFNLIDYKTTHVCRLSDLPLLFFFFIDNFNFLNTIRWRWTKYDIPRRRKIPKHNLAIFCGMQSNNVNTGEAALLPNIPHCWAICSTGGWTGSGRAGSDTQVTDAGPAEPGCKGFCKPKKKKLFMQRKIRLHWTIRHMFLLFLCRTPAFTYHSSMETSIRLVGSVSLCWRFNEIQSFLARL